MNDFFKINPIDVLDSFENGSLLLLKNNNSQFETLQGKKVEYNSVCFLVQEIKMGKEKERIALKLAPLV